MREGGREGENGRDFFFFFFFSVADSRPKVYLSPVEWQPLSPFPEFDSTIVLDSLPDLSRLSKFGSYFFFYEQGLNTFLFFRLQVVPPQHPRRGGRGPAEGARLRGQLPGKAVKGEPGRLHAISQARRAFGFPSFLNKVLLRGRSQVFLNIIFNFW